MERRIQRLGPINLAAIEEFAQLSERKQYLDAQNADLLEALTTWKTPFAKLTARLAPASRTPSNGSTLA